MTSCRRPIYRLPQHNTVHRHTCTTAMPPGSNLCTEVEQKGREGGNGKEKIGKKGEEKTKQGKSYKNGKGDSGGGGKEGNGGTDEYEGNRWNNTTQ